MRNVFTDTMKRSRDVFVLFALSSAVNLTVFALYRLNIEPFLYAELISAVLCLVLVLIRYVERKKRIETLDRAATVCASDTAFLPEPEDMAEAKYQEMLKESYSRISAENMKNMSEKQEMQDYYTSWVHQIKTPIAVMKLDLHENEAMMQELNRIERYAEMALTYIRLGCDENDLVVEECSLDSVIRETIRKYAPQFIRKKLRVIYDGTDKKVVTDRKWFACIIEQLVSNAVKYTNSGEVKISLEGEILSVSDTGIGIAKEDLPRIFEKGYTGLNGRDNRQSSGLGLFLARKSAEKLNIGLSVESVQGKGSTFSLDLYGKTV